MKTALKIVAIASLLMISACRHDPSCHSRIRGNGHYTETFYTLEYFNKVKFYETVNVHFSVGSNFEVRIKAESNIIDHIEVRNVAGLLSIRSKDGYCINARDIDIYITAPSINEIENDGTTEMDGEISTDNLRIVVNGTMDMDLSGHADRLSVITNGTCDFDLYDMSTKDTYIKCNGTARGKVRCYEHLNVDINGSATIRYKGNPQISQTINGSGKVLNDN